MNIAIITPNKNSSYLAECINSCISKNGHRVTNIISDCNSVNGIQNLIFSKRLIKNIVYLSSNDSGPAEAINLAFKFSEDEIIGWLNSDDLYTPIAIDEAIKCFEKNPNLKIIYGKAKHIDSTGKILSTYPTLRPEVGVAKFMDGNFICQPTVFFRKEVLHEVGYLDESLKTAFDLDFWIRVFKIYDSKQIGFINKFIAYSRLHDQCITLKYRDVVIQESMSVLHKHLGFVPTNWVLTYIDEIFTKYPFIDGNDSLIEIIKNFLSRVVKFIDPINLESLLNRLKNDARINFSNKNLFITLESDGWALKSLLIKLRTEPFSNQNIKLFCVAGWPFKGNLTLKVYDSKGVAEKVRLNSCDEFEIVLRRYNNSTRTVFDCWYIESENVFVPSKYIDGSIDNRGLSFKIKDVILQSEPILT